MRNITIECELFGALQQAGNKKRQKFTIPENATRVARTNDFLSFCNSAIFSKIFSLKIYPIISDCSNLLIL